MNPFLMTKPNNAPTFMIISQPQRQKTISILPIEEPKQNISEEVAKSALKLETARKISVNGDATGAAIFDGTADAEIRLIVKNASRATSDANGKEISKTYAAKTDLSEYAKKAEVTEKLNYIDTVLFATKSAVNNFQTEFNAAKEKLNDIEKTLAEITAKIKNLELTLDETRKTVSDLQSDLSDVINNGSTAISGENVTFAGESDIDNLFRS